MIRLRRTGWSGVSPRINSLESLFDKEGLREFGARGLKMEDYQDIRFNASDGLAGLAGSMKAGAAWM
jgi:hypothetical protein